MLFLKQSFLETGLKKAHCRTLLRGLRRTKRAFFNAIHLGELYESHRIACDYAKASAVRQRILVRLNAAWAEAHKVAEPFLTRQLIPEEREQLEEIADELSACYHEHYDAAQVQLTHQRHLLGRQDDLIAREFRFETRCKEYMMKKMGDVAFTILSPEEMQLCKHEYGCCRRACGCCSRPRMIVSGEAIYAHCSAGWCKCCEKRERSFR